MKRKYAVPMKVVHILRKVQQHILEEPKRFNMDVIADSAYHSVYPEMDKKDVKALLKEDKRPACGTAACIAGWVGLLNMPNVKKDEHGFWIPPEQQSMWDFAAKTLGLVLQDRLSRSQRDSISNGEYKGKTVDYCVFIQDSWPEPFRTKFMDEEAKRKPSLPKLAKIAVARIDHFLTTGK